MLCGTPRIILNKRACFLGFFWVFFSLLCVWALLQSRGLGAADPTLSWNITEKSLFNVTRHSFDWHLTVGDTWCVSVWQCEAAYIYIDSSDANAFRHTRRLQQLALTWFSSEILKEALKALSESEIFQSWSHVPFYWTVVVSIITFLYSHPHWSTFVCLFFDIVSLKHVSIFYCLFYFHMFVDVYIVMFCSTVQICLMLQNVFKGNSFRILFRGIFLDSIFDYLKEN